MGTNFQPPCDFDLLFHSSRPCKNWLSLQGNSRRNSVPLRTDWQCQHNLSCLYHICHISLHFAKPFTSHSEVCPTNTIYRKVFHWVTENNCGRNNLTHFSYNDGKLLEDLYRNIISQKLREKWLLWYRTSCMNPLPKKVCKIKLFANYTKHIKQKKK
jgi:hypothetical protein